MRITLLLLVALGLAACNTTAPGGGTMDTMDSMSDSGSETMENAEGMPDEGGI